MRLLNMLITVTILLNAFSVTAQPAGDPVAQTKDPVLFTVAGDPVTKSEFEYVFKKNNVNAHLHEKELREYLDLYVKFKLKVKEAEDLQIDTIPGVRNELGNYRSQLLNSYVEKEVLEPLMKETYKRISEDVRVSHIAVKLERNASPADTLKAYNKIMDIRKRLIKGENFEKVALQMSDDPNVKKNKGDLGFLTAMQMPLSAENAAYNTAVGKVSDPVRTDWGYHLIKPVAKRPALGQIQVAHILLMVDTNATKAEEEKIRKQAQEIYTQIEQGASFEELAKQYSQDVNSKDKGGVLPPYGTGSLETSFEEAALALKEDGDVAKPVRTSYGYHIIKRIQKADIPPYEMISEDLKKMVTGDERYKAAVAGLADKYKRQYGYIEYPQNREPLAALVDSSILRGKWDVADKGKYTAPLFNLEDDTYSQQDLLFYLRDEQSKYRMGPLHKILDLAYTSFVQQKVLDHGLSDRYPEYARLKQEYKDGIVMFELMEKKVWTKAIEDTAGLRVYYEKNKNKYMWDRRVDADIFVVDDAKTAKKVKKKARKMSNAELLEKFNEEGEDPVLKISSGKYEKGSNAIVDNIAWDEGWSDMNTSESGVVTIVRINKVMEPQPKSLQEARGFFIADYQDFLEKEWTKTLKAQYPVTVHEDVLRELFDEH